MDFIALYDKARSKVKDLPGYQGYRYDCLMLLVFTQIDSIIELIMQNETDKAKQVYADTLKRLDEI